MRPTLGGHQLTVSTANLLKYYLLLSLFLSSYLLDVCVERCFFFRNTKFLFCSILKYICCWFLLAQGVMCLRSLYVQLSGKKEPELFEGQGVNRCLLSGRVQCNTFVYISIYYLAHQIAKHNLY